MSSPATTTTSSERAIGQLQEQGPDSTEAAPFTDCLTCRLTGAGAFTAIGIHALNVARKDGAFNKVRPIGGSRVSGGLTAGLGVGELPVSFGLRILTRDQEPIELANVALFCFRKVFIALGLGRLAM